MRRPAVPAGDVAGDRAASWDEVSTGFCDGAIEAKEKTPSS